MIPGTKRFENDPGKNVHGPRLVETTSIRAFRHHDREDLAMLSRRDGAELSAQVVVGFRIPGVRGKQKVVSRRYGTEARIVLPPHFSPAPKVDAASTFRSLRVKMWSYLSDCHPRQEYGRVVCTILWSDAAR